MPGGYFYFGTISIGFGVGDNPFGSLTGGVVVVVHLVIAVGLFDAPLQFIEIHVFVGMVGDDVADGADQQGQ